MTGKVNSENEEFWGRTAGRYDRLMSKVRYYDAMVSRIAGDVGNAERVLDVATGTGRVALELAGCSNRVDAVDISPQMIAQASEKAANLGVDNVRFSVQGAYDLSFPDGTFDAVTACNALHVMQRADLALAEMKRVLKPGGLLVAPTYCHGQTLIAHITSRLMSLTGFRAFRRFTYASYVLLIKHAGFKVEKLDIWPGAIPLAYVTARQTLAGQSVLV
ncbi:MAG: class I SAM-dependent methyltransferase [Pseudomonadota bacterium]